MRILIYIPDIDRKLGGIYQYAQALLDLLAQDTRNEYFLFQKIHDPWMEKLANGSNAISLVPRDACTDSAFSYKWNRLKEELNTLLRKANLPALFRISYAIHKVIHKWRIDVLHCPYDLLPEHVNIPMLTTIHDLQELHYPAYFTPEERMERAIFKSSAIDRAGMVLSSYDHVKRDVELFFPVSRGKTKVCLLPMKHLWFAKLEPADHEFAEVNAPFILFPAATWQHKNHKNLLLALKEVKNKDLHLVCTGGKTDYYHKVLRPLIADLSLEDRVNFMGVVGEEKLLALYRRAEAVVVPTLYEAGSFPLMESLLMEIPVICSNVTSLPETIGDSDFTFDPNNPEEIADKINCITEDEAFRSRNVSNARLRGERLLHTDAMDILMSCYKQLQSATADQSA